MSDQTCAAEDYIRDDLKTLTDRLDRLKAKKLNFGIMSGNGTWTDVNPEQIKVCEQKIAELTKLLGE